MTTLQLLGMKHTGKSSLGRLWAARHGWDFYDLDALLEAQAGGDRTSRQIFQNEGPGGFPVGGRQLVESRGALFRIRGVGRDREGLARRPDRARDESAPAAPGEFRDGLLGQAGGFASHVRRAVLEAVLGLADSVGAQAVRRDDIGASAQVGSVYLEGGVGAAQGQGVVIAFIGNPAPLFEAPAVILLGQAEAL